MEAGASGGADAHFTSVDDVECMLIKLLFDICQGPKSPKTCPGYLPGIWRNRRNVPIFLGVLMDDGNVWEISKIFA
eukprot:6172972-Pleurochrysis_carterae.AAC.2